MGAIQLLLIKINNFIWIEEEDFIETNYEPINSLMTD